MKQLISIFILYVLTNASSGDVWAKPYAAKSYPQVTFQQKKGKDTGGVKEVPKSRKQEKPRPVKKK